MIAKGNLHGHGAKLAAYLTTEKDDERAELAELRGFETPEQTRTDLHEAFGEAELDAEATHCEKPFFHCYVRLPESERLSREQWFKCAGRLEKALGFTDQPRAVVFHHQADGDAHMHIVWSRIDLENECAINPGSTKTN
jgi:hypothetical protein